MKVFISWSGEHSRQIAHALYEWLPTVVQNVNPYMSTENIDKGERWAIDIANQLHETNYGIVCVTRDNLEAPWILFESGALSKSLENSRVSPIIFGLSPSELAKSPLLQFQLTQFNVDDMRKLIISINNSMPEGERLSEHIVVKSFHRAWPELETTVGKIIPSEARDTESASAPLGLGRIEDAIQEILTNTRSQIRILNSPSELLPAEYLNSAISLSRPLPSIREDDRAWVAIERAIRVIENLLRETIDKQLRDQLTIAVLDIQEGVGFIRRSLYSSERETARRAMKRYLLSIKRPPESTEEK